jgi:hypothetical protein
MIVFDPSQLSIIPPILTGLPDTLLGLVLLIVGILIIVLVVAAAIVLLPAVIVGIVVWFLSGSLLYAGIAFLIVAVIWAVAISDD